MTDIMQQFVIRASKSHKTINLAGDCMLDVFYNVKARYNPEANFPAYTVLEKPNILPGGAGNVAYCLSKLPVKCRIFGSLDTKARKIYEKHNLNIRKCVNANHTPRKQRYYNEGSLFQRIDIEHELLPCTGHGKMKSSDINVFSDYNKGTFRASWMDDYVAGSIVDAKPVGSVHKWLGCKTLKMNQKEALELTRMPISRSQYDWIRSVTSCENVIITNSNKGVHGVKDMNTSKKYFDIPQDRINARNVIGAGDSFLAILSYATSLGFDAEEASYIANHASKIYVQNSTRRPFTILDFVDDKIIVKPEILRERDFKLVFTNGCFDVMHAGHIECLKQAKSAGDKLVVALNSDASVRRIKGDTRPINNEQNRLKMLQALDMVDYILIFNDDTPYDVIKKIRPDVLVKGHPYTKENVVGVDLVKEVLLVPDFDGLSSTSIIERMDYNIN